MQRAYSCELTPDQYVATEAHRQVVPESICPRCGHDGPLHRHGTYGRAITNMVGRILRLLISRFLCSACRGTISYLPTFALTYRLVQAPTVQAFFEGRTGGRDVLTWNEVLQRYRRQVDRFAPQVLRSVGRGLGRSPPTPQRLWPWLKEACGSLADATQQLVSEYRITLFRRYECHQPARG